MKDASGFDYKNFIAGFIPGIIIGVIMASILIGKEVFGWFILIELLLLIVFDFKSRKEKGKLNFILASIWAGMVFGSLLFSFFWAPFLK